jgi:hypothetical protein
MVQEREESSFPHCRLLSRNCENQLCVSLARKILASPAVGVPNVTRDRVTLLLEFLTEEQLSREKLNEVLKLYPIEAHQEKLLTLRGLLACGVLVSR